MCSKAWSIYPRVPPSSPGSDVDVLVEFEQAIGLRFVEFAEHLETLLGARADILTPAGVASIRDPKIAESIRESAIDVQAF